MQVFFDAYPVYSQNYIFKKGLLKLFKAVFYCPALAGVESTPLYLHHQKGKAHGLPRMVSRFGSSVG